VVTLPLLLPAWAMNRRTAHREENRRPVSPLAMLWVELTNCVTTLLSPWYTSSPAALVANVGLWLW
jgi:hypothetical protein